MLRPVESVELGDVLLGDVLLLGAPLLEEEPLEVPLFHCPLDGVVPVEVPPVPVKSRRSDTTS
jgi:hypothetical protein